jgi:hypothetical protein
MDKIDIRDLRVDDLVYSSFSKTPCKVTEISLNESGYGVCKITGVDGHKDVASLSPIPLTEEILIQNGFPEDEWHGSFPEDKNGLLYIVLSFNKIFWEFNDCRIELKSVHQLQNLLQNLGIEKEIVL